MPRQLLCPPRQLLGLACGILLLTTAYYYLLALRDDPEQQEQQQPQHQEPAPFQQQDISSSSSSSLLPSADAQQQQGPLLETMPSPPPPPPVLIADLPASYIPTYDPLSFSSSSSPSDNENANDDDVQTHQTASARGKSKTTKNRLIIIGDVHGQLKPLRALLAKLRFNPVVEHGGGGGGGGDHLVLAGDLVNKGPESAGVVQLAMDLGASAVRGNHEDRVLGARRGHTNGSKSGSGSGSGSGSESKSGADSETAAQLSEEHVAWLEALPVMLRVGLPLSSSSHSSSKEEEEDTAGVEKAKAQPPWDASELVIVHAGLVPGVPLAEQDASAAMNMRSLLYSRPVSSSSKHKQHAGDGDGEGGNDLPTLTPVPVPGREGESWSAAWNRHQNALARSSDRVVVVYGHDAKAGLQVGARVEFDARADLDAIEARVREKEKKEEETKAKAKEKEGKKEKKEKKENEKKEKKKKKNEDESSGDGSKGEEEEKEKEEEKEEGKKKKDKNKNGPSPPEKLNGARYAFGLDSGCVYGRQLSAMIIEAGPEGLVHRIEQIECEAGVKTDD